MENITTGSRQIIGAGGGRERKKCALVIVRTAIDRANIHSDSNTLVLVVVARLAAQSLPLLVLLQLGAIGRVHLHFQSSALATRTKFG